MDKKNNIDYSILFKYFEQKATIEEQQLVSEWEKDVEKMAEIEEAYHIWNSQSKEHLVLKEEELDVLFNKNTRKYKRHLLRKSFVYYCLVGLCLFSTLFIFNHYQRDYEGLYIVKTMNNKLGNTEVWLSDSTHVILSKGSILKLWDIKDAKNYRAIRLRGKAFFDVAKNKEKPFLIETGTDMVVKVLGTSFVLNTDDTNFDLGLITGKVELVETTKLNEKNTTNTIIHPGQYVHLKSNDKENKLDIDSLNINKAMRWTKPMLDFQAVALGRVLDNLSEYYAMSIECDDELRNKYRCTIQISEESVEETTHILETILPLKITRINGKIYIVEKNKLKGNVEK